MKAEISKQSTKKIILKLGDNINLRRKSRLRTRGSTNDFECSSLSSIQSKIDESTDEASNYRK